MPRRLTLALLGVLMMFATASVAPADGTAAQTKSSTTGIGSAALTGSSAESENPINDQGSNYNYRSEITSISPKVAGLGIEVLEFADRLVLTNHTGKTVTVYGYSGEPYARVQANGTTEQNLRSPAVYLNTNFYGNVTVPASASASDPPKWVVVDRGGSFEWHDHRIHWMSPVTPPQVKDKKKRTLIFHWSVPISVGKQKGVVAGQLFWVPESSKAPKGAIVALIAILLLALVFVIVVRRHRSGLARSGRGGEEANGSGGKEAW